MEPVPRRLTKIGQNGKPLAGQPELSPAERPIVQANKALTRQPVDSLKRYFGFKQK